jgi:NAD(P)-dependent dehydrogenase (short-subunit alcohol dehydrogenase family)
MLKRAELAGHFPPVETMIPFIPVRRAGTPDDVAAARILVCSDDGSFITGQQIGVNDGMCMPARAVVDCALVSS